MPSTIDQQIDQVSRDYVRTAGGEWEESEDSRTAVLFQLEMDYGAWWGDSSLGSRIGRMLSNPSGESPTAEELRDEALRALQLLADDGIISELEVDIDEDERGQVVLAIHYRDRAGARPVDLIYSPFGG